MRLLAPRRFRLEHSGCGYALVANSAKRRNRMLITILIILAIVALALFVWRNMAAKRV